MKKPLLLLLLFIVVPKTNAQHFINENKRNSIWFNGYDNNYLLAHPNEPIAGGTCINFNTNANFIAQCYNELDFLGTNASICDTAGNLLFYTNGLHVGNKNLRKMAGRDTLNTGNYTNILLNSPNEVGRRCYRSPQGAIILPNPNRNNIYSIFHIRTANPPLQPSTGVQINDRLLYSVVDMSQDSGRGKVIQINQPIINYDTLASGMLSACRHANGRDWWLIVWKYDTNQYMPILFDSQGVHLQGWQSVPRAIGLHDIDGQTCFSPDGTRYARHEGYDWQDGTGNWLDIFDFDRCRGLLSNQTTINIPVDNGGVGSVAFSPNSEILYAGTSYHIFQYDMTVPLAQVAVTQDTVGVYDYHFDAGLPTTYYTMQLAPNGKIYLCTGASTRYYHIIDNPNVRGAGCNVINHGLHLNTYQWQGIVNQPYFALGPIDGSPCDTLGINNPVTTQQANEKEGFLKVFPNPTAGILNIEIPENIKGNAIIYNHLGQFVKTFSLFEAHTQIKTYDLPNGIYFLSVFDATKQCIGTKRVVVLHD